MELQLDNAQGVPHITIRKGKKRLATISLCKDGAIICVEGNIQGIGTQIGCRNKGNQATYIDAAITDDIKIKI